MIIKELSNQVQEAARKKGYLGPTILYDAINGKKKKQVLSRPRISKIWRGEGDAKIVDYMLVCKFLDVNLTFISGSKNEK